MEDQIVNKVAQSGLITLDLEDYAYDGELVAFDMKDQLFQGLILKERDFRTFLKEEDWSKYEGKDVALFCSVDAIVPTWAYMLISNRLAGIARQVRFENPSEFRGTELIKALKNLDVSEFADKRLVIKGCSDGELPIGAYVEITNLLTPHVKSIMYGEPCSTVPIYKKK